ncbi:MAG: DUF5320 domain-containing protein [Deltaproteobacteria bacterium]|nr:DUF5320 domain-containing protein [Deltaproteobacteria bacterium]
MPGFDRTGPMGEGPKTGRQLGRCNSKQQTQSAEVDQDQQMNRGRRLGVGRRADRGGRGGGGFKRRSGSGKFQQ